MSFNILFSKLLIISFIFSINAGFCQDWKKDTCTLNGTVKYVKFETKVSPMPSSGIYEYNPQGFLVKLDITWTGFMAGHNGIYRIFDDSGERCIKEYRAYENAISQHSDMHYNDDGQLEKKSLFNHGKHWSTTNYRYNEKGELIEKFVVFQSDSDTIYHYFEYDSEGRMIKDSDLSATSIEIKSWKYDENGLVLEEQFIDTNRASATYKELDGNGNWVVVKRDDYSANANTSESYIKTFEYNKKGQVIKELMTNIDGTPSGESIMTYDQSGFLIAEKIANLDNGYIANNTYVYKFDDRGNWVKKTTKVNGEIEKIEVRRISYH